MWIAAQEKKFWPRKIAGAMDAKTEDWLAAQGSALSPQAQEFAVALATTSPFLRLCLHSAGEDYQRIVCQGPEPILAEVHEALRQPQSHQPQSRQSQPRWGHEALADFLCTMRVRGHLAIACGDLSGAWSLEQVVAALTQQAQDLLHCALAQIFAAASIPGLKPDAAPEDCGLVILAMGKLGAESLNFSSDYDLIALYEPAALPLRANAEADVVADKIIRALIAVCHRRGPLGQVARLDFRLRPDPSASPLAHSCAAAVQYYESRGRSWERAAMIKARPLVGQREIGEAFLREIEPFRWRRTLDFEAVEEIKALQSLIATPSDAAFSSLNSDAMNSDAMAGFDIKRRAGGIRSIEFFVQSWQLVFGGRDPSLRGAATLPVLAALSARGLISPQIEKQLSEAYRRWRWLEHRLQMRADQQTHRLPETQEDFAAFAALCGYARPEDLSTQIKAQRDLVCSVIDKQLPGEQRRATGAYAEGAYAKLACLADDEADPLQIQQRLASLGFRDPQQAYHLISGWRAGGMRALASQRARRLLDDVLPKLITGLSQGSEADRSLARCDEFFKRLSAGVHTLGLLNSNPQLLALVIEILGCAPRLAEQLALRPELLDSVFTAEFFTPLEPRDELKESLAAALTGVDDLGVHLVRARLWSQEMRFRAGVHLLRNSHNFDEISQGLSRVAAVSLASVADAVRADYGRLQELPEDFAILALGRLGSQEMIPGSDLDLLFIIGDGAALSGAGDPILACARLAQRLITGITTRTASGRLYRVDTRLAICGRQLVVPLEAFRRYFREDTWVFEYMALTRARPIWGAARLCADLKTAVAEALCCHHVAPDKLKSAVKDMRARLAKEHGICSAWDVKHRPGGLLDADFALQYLQLLHAPRHPEILARSTRGVCQRLTQAGILPLAQAQQLMGIISRLRQLQALARLTLGEGRGPSHQQSPLADLFARAADCPDLLALERRLEEDFRHIGRFYAQHLGDER